MLPSQTAVLIIGGGPAGTLLGCLLARRGISVLVVEKQSRAERTFRGESIMGPAVDVLRRLGFAPALRAHGYFETLGLTIAMEGRRVLDLDYQRFATAALPIDIPQTSLIEIFDRAGAQEPGYRRVTGTAMTELIEQDGKVVGAVLREPDGTRVPVRARLVVGADGRYSKVRKEAGIGAVVAPMNRDVIWFKVARPEGWPHLLEVTAEAGRHLVTVPGFGRHIRVATSLPKGGYVEARAAGFDAFSAMVRRFDPRLGPLMEADVRSWDDTSFLDVFTAEVAQWARDGLVLIGDASHTVTPILGAGVTLAIHDAVGLTPIVAAELARTPRGPLPAAALEPFVAARRAHKRKVTRFQLMQEQALSVSAPLALAPRRARYHALNHLPGRYLMMANIMTTPRPIDPVDVRALAGRRSTLPAADGVVVGV